MVGLASGGRAVMTAQPEHEEARVLVASVCGVHTQQHSNLVFDLRLPSPGHHIRLRAHDRCARQIQKIFIYVHFFVKNQAASRLM